MVWALDLAARAFMLCAAAIALWSIARDLRALWRAYFSPWSNPYDDDT